MAAYTFCHVRHGHVQLPSEGERRAFLRLLGEVDSSESCPTRHICVQHASSRTVCRALPAKRRPEMLFKWTESGGEVWEGEVAWWRLPTVLKVGGDVR